jgi:hypothetical protein
LKHLFVMGYYARYESITYCSSHSGISLPSSGARENLAPERALVLKLGSLCTFPRLAVYALLVSVTVLPDQARAQEPAPSAGQAVAIFAIMGAIGGAIGFGIYHGIHRSHMLTGCAVSGAHGLELRNKGDQQTYALAGNLADINPGKRVRISGKKGKHRGDAPRPYLVEKLQKDYGPCTDVPAASNPTAAPTP